VLSAGAQLTSTGTAPASLCANTGAAQTAANTQSSLATAAGSAGTVSASDHCSMIILAIQAAATANSDGTTPATAYVTVFSCPSLSGPDATELTYLCGVLQSTVTKYAPTLKVIGNSCALTPSASKKRSVMDASYNYQANFAVAPNSSSSAAVVGMSLASALLAVILVMLV